LAITASAQLFYSEIENRTALTLLAKPVRNLEFLAGKFLGIQLLMLSFVLLLSLLLVVMLWWREAALSESTKVLDYGDFWCYGLVQWGRFGILCAISLMIGSFARSYLFTLMLSFLIMMVGQLQYLARDSFIEISFMPLRWLVQGLGLFFPNLQLFNIGDQLGDVAMGGVPMLQLAQLMLYAGIYWVAYLFLAWWVFRRREI
jgi:ABC-type transport system involved in multi-copper enzyme maturation permease subunit